jgi:SAM-dependent methyltransferase
MTFKDHFSGHADRNGAFRPTYPAGLFEYLASLCPSHDLAWDCATGNGQAALALTPHFRSVVATDASERQIAQARPHHKITYSVAPAERTPLPDASVDLVTVAQALHWLDLPSFYAEVRRVSVPGGVIAVWCYQLHTIGPEVDAVVHRLYTEILGDYWPPERRLVEEGYRTLPFPFAEVAPPPFEMVQAWDLPRLLSYLGTWSSSQRYRAQVGTDPIDLIRADMEAAWGGPSQVREVVWPLHLRVGIISGTKP